MIKSADAFRTISEVAEWLDTETLLCGNVSFPDILKLSPQDGFRYESLRYQLLFSTVTETLSGQTYLLKKGDKFGVSIKMVQSNNEF